MGFMIGFDLDMTLVDSRDGITFTTEKVLAELGVQVPSEEIFNTIGLPLWDSFPKWIAPGQVDAAVVRYRELYKTVGVPITTVLPGARESLDAIHAAGGSTMVVSAKLEAAVLKIVTLLDLPIDVVRGDLFAAGKATALLEENAVIYVGDHPADVIGARAAGAISVAVVTGPASYEDLRAEGAEVILNDLLEFPAWFLGWLGQS
jgi:phosphoglycolate phosphatase-like HAD superfamily hydrolase